MSPRRRLSEDLLSAYVDGELDADTRAAVDARLAQSSDWRAVLEEIRGAKDAVRGLPAVDLPPDTWDRLLARVASHPVYPNVCCRSDQISPRILYPCVASTQKAKHPDQGILHQVLTVP